MSAIHFGFYNIAPTESDPDGDEALACGREHAEKVTTDESKTTCKLCLKALKKESK